MRNYYSDPTATAAIGAFNKDWNKMQRKANRMKALYLKGKLNYEEEEKAYKQFKGIYRLLLDKALQEAVEEEERMLQAKLSVLSEQVDQASDQLDITDATDCVTKVSDAVIL